MEDAVARNGLFVVFKSYRRASVSVPDDEFIEGGKQERLIFRAKIGFHQPNVFLRYMRG
jgi:hypothetical protein